MQAIINPSTLHGSVTPPASKSMMQRACAGALLHAGKTVIKNPGHSDDDMAALNIIKDLGAEVRRQEDGSIEIVSDGTVHSVSSIDCGESGLSARMFAPIAALADSQVTITGKGSLLHRPMNALQELLLSLGVNLPGFNGYLPITLRGPLLPKNVRISSSHSSQYLTGALFALTAAAQQPLTIEVPELYSKPYVDLTLAVLTQFGKTVKHEDYMSFYIDPSAFARPETVTVQIEADWSSAAYLLTGAAINGNVSVNQLSFDTTQADKAIVDVLEMAGAKLAVEHGKVSVSSAEKLRSFQFDATHSPDLFPILAILAACAEGESKMTGIRRLIHKESNRSTSITDMLRQFGVHNKTEGDSLIINGRGQLRSTTVDSHNDHRIAMAAAIGALNAEGPVMITQAHVVSKSYPDFFNHLASLGAQVEQKA